MSRVRRASPRVVLCEGADGARGQFTATTFPILAPLPVELNASALAFFIFVRTFFQVRGEPDVRVVSAPRPLTSATQAWGITVGATVLQNQLRARLPRAFLATLPRGVEISYAAITQVRGLGEPLKGEVRAAFAGALDVLWEVMIAVAGVGFVTAWVMREVPMQRAADENWGLDEKAPTGAADGGADVELDTV